MKNIYIKFTGDYSYSVMTRDNKKIDFKKGKNSIDIETWKELKENPLVKERLKKGILIIMQFHTTQEEIENEDKEEENIEDIETEKEEPENKIDDDNEDNIDDDSNSDNDEQSLSDLKELTAKEAIEAIKMCTSMEMLKKWKKNETRVTVKDAIIAQLKQLKEIDNA